MLFARGRRKDGKRLRPGQRCITCHPPPPLHEQPDHGGRDTRAAGRPLCLRHPAPDRGGSKAPYLHDGRATTLLDIFDGSLEDRHGFVSDLTPDEIRDLIVFLESL